MSDQEHDEIQVNEGRKVGVTVSLRLKPDEAEVLASLSQRYEMTLSETLRLALSSLARSADYSKLSVQTSGIGSFTSEALGSGDRGLVTA
jgi:hypothetical protein